MLQTIRDRASGWLAYLIIFLVSIPFLLWGVNNYFGQEGKRNVAEVNGQAISVIEFTKAYREQRMRLEQIFGGSLPSGLTDQSLKQMILSDLIKNAVLQQETEKAGYHVTDLELLEQLKKYPAFQVNGKFSRTRYLQLLRANGIEPGVFEEKLRKNIAVQQLQEGIQNTAFVTKTEAKRYILLSGEKRQVNFVIIPASNYLSHADVTEAEIKKYYESHKNEFMMPERVRLSYVSVSLQEIQDKIHPTDKELRRYYQEHETQFEQPERALASEIVINLGNSATNTDAEQRIRTINKALSDKIPFEQLAKRYSEAENAKQGGSMGWVQRTSLPHQLAAVLFSMKEGEVSPPIRVGNKVYFLKLEKLKRPEKQSYESVKKQVYSQYVSILAKDRFDKLVQKLQSLTYQNPTSIEPLAKALGLSVQVSGWIARNEKTNGVLGSPEVIKAAFSNPVLKQGLNSQPILLDNTQVVVLRVSDHQPPRVKSLSQVKERIVSRIKHEQSLEFARKQAQALLKLAVAQRSLESAVKSKGFEIHNAGWVGRTTSTLPSGLINAIFTSSAPSAHGRSYGLWQDANRGIYLFEIHNIEYPKVDEKRLQKIQSELQQAMGADQLQMAYQALERQAKIRVYESNLNF